MTNSKKKTKRDKDEDKEGGNTPLIANLSKLLRKVKHVYV